MITVSNLGMQFGGQWLFQHVDLQFLPGNCYGIIGANGAGKSTFLRILTGDLDSTTGSISIDPDKRMSVLKQNQNAYDEYTILDTVIMGNQHLYEVMKEKDAIYEKPDFTDEDGLRLKLFQGIDMDELLPPFDDHFFNAERVIDPFISAVGRPGSRSVKAEGIPGCVSGERNLEETPAFKIE